MDLKLENGDLVLINSVTNLYDLGLETDETKEDINLIKRAITTPITYITEWDALLNELDNLFGNPLYIRLSDPLTINWMTSARQDIVSALKGLTISGSIRAVELRVKDLDKITVNITYNSDNLEINLR